MRHLSQNSTFRGNPAAPRVQEVRKKGVWQVTARRWSVTGDLGRWGTGRSGTTGWTGRMQENNSESRHPVTQKASEVRGEFLGLGEPRPQGNIPAHTERRDSRLGAETGKHTKEQTKKTSESFLQRSPVLHTSFRHFFRGSRRHSRLTNIP